MKKFKKVKMTDYEARKMATTLIERLGDKDRLRLLAERDKYPTDDEEEMEKEIVGGGWTSDVIRGDLIEDLVSDFTGNGWTAPKTYAEYLKGEPVDFFKDTQRYTRDAD